MKIIQSQPPNIEEIRIVLGEPPENACFCYGGTIYNPSGNEIPPDTIHHESIHSERQGSDPQRWWYHYLRDAEFRLKEEIIAYGEQYLFAKAAIDKADDEARGEGKRLIAGHANLLKHALESMAMALSGEAYGNLISYGEAEAKIRNYQR